MPPRAFRPSWYNDPAPVRTPPPAPAPPPPGQSDITTDPPAHHGGAVVDPEHWRRQRTSRTWHYVAHLPKRETICGVGLTHAFLGGVEFDPKPLLCPTCRRWLADRSAGGAVFID